MDSAADTPCGSGLPHSEILGSKPARGSPRLFAACHVLHRLLAPRHPPDALAFLGPHQRQPHHTPHQVYDLGGDPARGRTAPTKTKQDAAAAAGEQFQRQLATTSARPIAWPKRQAAKHTHANDARPAADGRREAGRASTCRRPSHARRTRREIAPACPQTGTSSPPHDVQRTIPRHAAQAPNRARRRGDGAGVSLRDGRARTRATTAASLPRGSEAWWAWADLNGRPHAYQACALTS